MTTTIYSGEIFAQHETGQSHPENGQRSRMLHQKITGLISGTEEVTVGQIPPLKILMGESYSEEYFRDLPWYAALERVHEKELIKKVFETSRAGGGQLDADTKVSSRSFEVALTAVATLCQGVDDLFKGGSTNVLSLIRPPGHHATADQSMGFCLFNNIAVAARYAQTKYDLHSLLIIDWDVHHGNGTQDIFYADPTVGFLSIHRFPFYPGSGHADERGVGPGLGTTFNIPIAYGTSRQEYFERFFRGVEQAAATMRPELILISAGFDAHECDPVGDLGLKTEDYGVMTDFVMDVARTYCGGRLLSSLEGGYDLKALCDSVAVHAAHLAK
jgi:acetoin utilization deacetylase AcuC-like enzyme